MSAFKSFEYVFIYYNKIKLSFRAIHTIIADYGGGDAGAAVSQGI